MYYQRPAQVPLPAGWEAKYDPGSRKWFYLNHQTKTTQWEDPRLTLQQTPTTPRQVSARPTMQQHQQSQAATTSFMEVDPAKVKTIISDYNIDEELVKSLLRTHNNNLESVRNGLKEMGYVKKVKANEQFVATLKKEYPEARNFTIVDQLMKTNNSMQETRMNLEILGYKRESTQYQRPKETSFTSQVQPKQQFVDMLKAQYPSAMKSTIKDQLITCNNSVQGARLGLEAMGYKKKDQERTVKAESKPKKVASKPAVDAKKAKMDLKRKFPHLDDTTIELCLKVANNDVDMASKILDAKKEKDQKKEVTREFRRSTPPQEEEQTRDFSPKVFGSDEPSSSSSTSVFSPTQSSDQSLQSSSSNTKEVVSKPSSRTKFQPIEKKLPQQTKHVTRVVVKRDGDYKSKLRIEPVGSNPALCNGPNSDLLLKSYAVRHGPNAMNRKGPQMLNRCGPQLSNRKGPAGISMGPAISVV